MCYTSFFASARKKPADSLYDCLIVLGIQVIRLPGYRFIMHPSLAVAPWACAVLVQIDPHYSPVERFIPYAGPFAETMRAIPLIRQAGMFCAIMGTVSSENVGELPDVVGLVGDMNVDVFAFGRCCPRATSYACVYAVVVQMRMDSLPVVK